MPIHLPAAPDDASQAARAQLSSILSAPHAEGEGQLQAMSLAATAGTLTLSQPHRVYLATAADVVAGAILSSAKEDSWRYLVINNSDEAVAAVEVIARGGGPMELAHINEGPFVAGTVDAIANAEEQVRNAPRDFEVRLLRIPSLYLIALWLHASDTDGLIPIAPAPAGLVAGVAITEAELAATLRPLAEQRTRIEEGMG
ncbi:MAG TPA: hypothetical protein VNN08_14920 [Thermoanaerobaculia bacterium]|nr:hypothetical protein [Thermoanaerobaculia bacterium]